MKSKINVDGTVWMKVRWQNTIVKKKNKMQMKMKKYFKNEIQDCKAQGDAFVITWEKTWIRLKDWE